MVEPGFSQKQDKALFSSKDYTIGRNFGSH
jgi:hypothetical protein